MAERRKNPGIDAWTAPSFTNSWTNFGGSWAPVGYRLDESGIVHLHGIMVPGSFASAAFSLPVGYRPEADLTFVVVVGEPTSFGRVNIIASPGAVTPIVGFSGTGCWFSLDGVLFHGTK